MTIDTNKRYWLYAPGDKAKYWDEFYTQGIMAIGWDEIGDLSHYSNSDEMKAKMISIYYRKNSPNNDSLCTWDFAHTIKKGDIVIAKQGRDTIVGYGIVTSDYFFDEHREHYRNVRKIDWKCKGVWQHPGKAVPKTLTDITTYPEYLEKILKLFSMPSNTSNLKSILLQKNNIILQGAPGVGKTYTTAALALSICGETIPSDHEEVMKRYEELQKEGRIGFVTFHQSMDYEDFVEGIKPSTDNGQITYDIENGIFKEMCRKALSENNFDEVYAKFTSAIEDYTEENPFKLKTPSGSQFAVFVNSKGNLALCAGSSLKKYAVLTKENLLSFFIDPTSILYYKSYFRGVISHLITKYNLKNTKSEKKNYVIIIDEINRGNVSKIFGELISLLEADKRIGGNHPLKVTLPYSKTEFGVPSNLYIIGTMNTTDRSVGNIDYAVRRRFAFVTIKADKNVLIEKYGENSLQVNLFNSVNQYVDTNNVNELDIEDLKVGHSFFMVDDVDKLQLNLDYEIIPLIKEYIKDGLLKSDGFEKEITNWQNMLK